MNWMALSLALNGRQLSSFLHFIHSQRMKWKEMKELNGPALLNQFHLFSFHSNKFIDFVTFIIAAALLFSLLLGWVGLFYWRSGLWAALPQQTNQAFFWIQQRREINESKTAEGREVKSINHHSLQWMIGVDLISLLLFPARRLPFNSKMFWLNEDKGRQQLMKSIELRLGPAAANKLRKAERGASFNQTLPFLHSASFKTKKV